MCSPTSPAVSTGERGLYFDYNNDDYWDPPDGALPWWTANLNRFLCPDVNCNVSGGTPLVSSGTGTGSQGSGSGTGAGTGPGTTVTSAKRKPLRLRTKVRRSSSVSKRDLWNMTLRVTGDGRAQVDIRCRRAKSAKLSSVVVRRVKLPRVLRSSVRCASRPTASARVVG